MIYKITLALMLAILLPLQAKATENKMHNKPKITIMTFNIENGGTQVSFAKVAEAIRKAKADVVGIQEAWGNTERLANTLGWQYCNKSQAIISRLPLLEPQNSHGIYTFVEVQPGKVIAVANTHLPDPQYGPDMIKHGASPAELERMEQKNRLPVALPYLNQLATLAKYGTPVFLTGDFNSPSHLDWTTANINQQKYRPFVVIWPVTQLAQEKGLIDSYRAIYPNSEQTPGATWPAGRPFLKNSLDGFNPTKNDFPERLDFIFTAGKSRPIESKIIGETHNPNVDIGISPYPSDHRALATTFEVEPTTAPPSSTLRTMLLNHPEARTKITVNSKTFKPGQPIKITWTNAPGNRYDYIRISPAGTTKLHWGEAVRLYTHANPNGSIEYGANNVKGNWLIWHTGEEDKWPLPPGTYNIKLMLDDSLTSLATTTIVIL